MSNATAKPQQVVIREEQPPAPVSESSAIISMIERAARDPAVDIDKMERLIALQERAIAQRAEQAFNEAMSAAQSEMRAVAADSNNPQTKSKYASYAALDRAMRPIYTKHGFALSFNTEVGAVPDHVRVTCRASHRAGHSQKYQIDMPADGKGAKGGDVMTKTHAVGAGMTYGQRYLLKLIFNIAVGDDVDGNKPLDLTPITEAEVIELRDIIESLGAETPKVLAYVSKKANAEITKLSEIPAAHYATVKTALANWANKAKG